MSLVVYVMTDERKKKGKENGTKSTHAKVKRKTKDKRDRRGHTTR